MRRLVQPFSGFGDLSRSSIKHHDSIAVRLKTGPFHRVKSDEFSVGRVNRVVIVPLHSLGNILRRLLAGNFVEIDVAVGRLSPIGCDLGRVGDLFSVRRPGKLFAACKGRNGAVAENSSHQVTSFARAAVSAKLGDVEVRVLIVVPTIPVSIH